MHAHFTIEATGIVVDFDRFTLQGATLVDTDGDVAWDMTDCSGALQFSTVSDSDQPTRCLQHLCWGLLDSAQ